ncbi:MAG: hypothetical protein IJP74_03925 [Prevotella sp.]|nr:hypothetical protein [Prevotella sp.]
MTRRPNILPCCRKSAARLFLSACRRVPVLLSALLLLTACSDYDSSVLEPSPAERLANADSVYLNISIVNSATVTRATEEGSSLENAVYDGILCIFENDALKSAVVIDQLISNPYEPQAVVGGSATSINVTQRLKNIHAYGGSLSAAVLLNTTRSGFYADNGKLYFRTQTTDQQTGEVTFGTPEDMTGKSFSNIENHDINDVGSTDRHVGLFMKSTASVATTPSDHLFDTEEVAATNFSTGHITINVERVAAKVTVHSDLTSGDDITNITLNGTSTKAKFHAMRWTLSPAPGYIAKDFTDFHQHALKSDDAVYVKPTSSATVVVELQVKDGSFLIDEGYIFNYLSNNVLYSSSSQYLNYLKSGIDYQKGNYDLGDRNGGEIFRQPTIYINNDGTVTLTLTNYSLNDTEQAGLENLASALSGWTTGYRDGKMYYSFPVNDGFASNNAYTLTFDDSSIPYIGTPTPPTP